MVKAGVWIVTTSETLSSFGHWQYQSVFSNTIFVLVSSYATVTISGALFSEIFTPSSPDKFYRVYICTSVYVCVYLHKTLFGKLPHIYMYICVYICIYIYVHVCMCVYIYIKLYLGNYLIYIYMYIYVYIHMYTCVCVCIFT
jgi:hypothetical protein